MSAKVSIVHKLTLCATVAAIMLWSQGARACQCDLSDHGFLVTGAVTLPRNAKGVPWAGRLAEYNDSRMPPDSARFTVEIRDQETWRRVAFSVVPVPDVAVGSTRSARGEVLALVAPRAGLRAGRRYRFTFWNAGTFHRKERTPETLRVVQDVIVDVSKRSFLPGSEEPRLSIDSLSTAKVVTSTRGGGCSTRFLGRQARVVLELPPTLRQWSDALVYVLRTGDGQVWRPDPNLCEPTPPGLNSLGRGSELLFSWCGRWPEDVRPDGSYVSGGSPDALLAPRQHPVEFTAWLPGTDVRVVGRGVVDLTCVRNSR